MLKWLRHEGVKIQRAGSGESERECAEPGCHLLTLRTHCVEHRTYRETQCASCRAKFVPVKSEILCKCHSR